MSIAQSQKEGRTLQAFEIKASTVSSEANDSFCSSMM